MSKKQALDEGFAIDSEWDRINQEKDAQKAGDAELDDDLDAYNAKVREINSRGGGTPEESNALHERKNALDQKEALLIERKRRLLYDIQEVNKKSRSFNDKYLPIGVEPKTIRNFQMSANGENLTPLPYKKGEPLQNEGARGSSPKGGPRSPAGKGSGSPTGKGAEVKSRSYADKPKGGAHSQPSSRPEEESRLIDQEWTRIDHWKQSIAAKDEEMKTENERLNNRIMEVNKMKNNSAQIAEVDAWQNRFDRQIDELVEEKRHLLYDVDLVNARSTTLNETAQDLPPKVIKSLTYTFNREKLSPLPYGK